MLLVILNSVRFLGRQGLALRGRYKTSDDPTTRGEIDSNFMQLLRLRAEDSPGIVKWIDRPQNMFTSPDIQNEMLSITVDISGRWFTLMVDETTDTSNTEQMVVCLRFVDNNLKVHGEVVGLYSLESTSAQAIVSTIKDVLLRMNLRIGMCRGQCYDGASNMSGGVATQIALLERRALYTHCYGHALNLATQDALRGVKIMGDTLDTVYEITKLIKKSPKRETIFTTGSPGIRILCPTRWTEALSSISENYEALQLTWDEAMEATRDTEMRARIGGVSA